MPDIVQRLRNVPSALLSDSVRGMHTLDPGIRCLTPGLKLVGPAFTVLAEAGSIITVHKALLEAPEGAVLVVGGETGKDLRSAMFGKLMSLQAQHCGILGLVLDGSVRDLTDVIELGFPVYARGTSPRVGLNRRVGRTQLPVPCGGMIVNPGDFVCGDEDGVTIIPVEIAERVVEQAEERLRKEADLARRIRDGEHITDMIGFTELINDSEGSRQPDGV